jgi:hypothetical protein
MAMKRMNINILIISFSYYFLKPERADCTESGWCLFL